MGVFVKICGLANREDTLAVAELGPDALGFNFWPRSKRYVRPEDAAAWLPELPPEIRKVGLFVDAAMHEVAEVSASLDLDVVQLHGNEPPSEVNTLNGEVWKAVHLDRMDRGVIKGYRVDAFLVDSYSTDSPGGTGKVADWNLARDFVAETPVHVLLAGGLTPDNVQEAIQTVHPWGVDVSSGVEERPGKKDLERVKRFIETCRNS